MVAQQVGGNSTSGFLGATPVAVAGLLERLHALEHPVAHLEPAATPA